MVKNLVQELEVILSSKRELRSDMKLSVNIYLFYQQPDSDLISSRTNSDKLNLILGKLILQEFLFFFLGTSPSGATSAQWVLDS